MRIILAGPIILHEANHTVLASHSAKCIPERNTRFTGDLSLRMKQRQDGRHRLKLAVFLMAAIGNAQQQNVCFRETNLHTTDSFNHPVTIPSIMQHTVAHHIQPILENDQVIRTHLAQTPAACAVQTGKDHTGITSQRIVIYHNARIIFQGKT